VLRHEIEHVLNGDGRDSAIVDSDLYPNEEVANLSPMEQKANIAAEEFCVSRKSMDDFVARKGPLFSKQAVLLFAKSLKVHPGLVVGQLQRRIGRWDLFRPMLIPIREIVTSVSITDGYGHVLPI
jgi:HTH-type transcriptional regulator/antitoxin HigA